MLLKWIKKIFIVDVVLIGILICVFARQYPQDNPIERHPILNKADQKIDQETNLKDELTFKDYQTLNQDYICQIVFMNDLLNLPVVQSHLEDTRAAYDQYLRTDFKTMQPDQEGSIFLDPNNQLTDQNLVIYGHYVYRFLDPLGTHKFSPLHLLKKSQNYQKYHELKLIFENEVRTYEIAHVYYAEIIKDDYGRESLKPGTEYMFANYSNEQLATYLSYVNANEFYETGVEIGNEDRFLTLQTCVENRDDLRLIVIAKEIGVEKL